MGSGNKALRLAANTFDRIRKQYDPSSTYDIFIRSPMNDAQLYWFVGKVGVEPVDNNSDGPYQYTPTVQDACKINLPF
jgi:hypothetical protein